MIEFFKLKRKEEDADANFLRANCRIKFQNIKNQFFNKKIATISLFQRGSF